MNGFKIESLSEIERIITRIGDRIDTLNIATDNATTSIKEIEAVLQVDEYSGVLADLNVGIKNLDTKAKEALNETKKFMTNQIQAHRNATATAEKASIEVQNLLNSVKNISNNQ